MKAAYILIGAVAANALLFAGCDQTAASFPECGGTWGDCGPWYPGGEADGGPSPAYAIAEGETFPCLVWEAARVDHADTWINVGELHLGIKHGVSDDKALVIILTGDGCAGCYELVQALAARQAEFEDAAVMLGMCHGDLAAEEPYTLDEAEQTLVEQDGWPAEWLLTNDAEQHLPIVEYQGLPWVVVVRLSDMRVMVRSNMDFAAANVDELLALIQSF